MSDKPIAVIIGIFLGIFHGFILMLSLISFQLASFILYRDRYLLPIATTGIIDIVSLFTVLTSGWWLPFVMKVQEKYTQGEIDVDNLNDEWLP